MAEKTREERIAAVTTDADTLFAAMKQATVRDHTHIVARHGRYSDKREFHQLPDYLEAFSRAAEQKLMNPGIDQKAGKAAENLEKSFRDFEKHAQDGTITEDVKKRFLADAKEAFKYPHTKALQSVENAFERIATAKEQAIASSKPQVKRDNDPAKILEVDAKLGRKIKEVALNKASEDFTGAREPKDDDPAMAKIEKTFGKKKVEALDRTISLAQSASVKPEIRDIMEQIAEAKSDATREPLKKNLRSELDRLRIGDANDILNIHTWQEIDPKGRDSLLEQRDRDPKSYLPTQREFIFELLSTASQADVFEVGTKKTTPPENNEAKEVPAPPTEKGFVPNQDIPNKPKPAGKTPAPTRM